MNLAMFERYTEKARRVVFFARYEASQYGNPFIDPEHILLGILREDRALMRHIAGPIDFEKRFRTEVERLVPLRERIPNSVEVPLSASSRKVLVLAAEEAEKLKCRFIGPEHLLLGIVGLKDSLAATLLASVGASAKVVRDKIAKGVSAETLHLSPAHGAILVIGNFLAVLKEGSERPANFFYARGQFIDSSGKRWSGRNEIDSAAETLFAPFAKKNVRAIVEDTINGPSETVATSVLWELPSHLGDLSTSMLRMSIVLAYAGQTWLIVLAQVTPVLPGPNPVR